MNVIQVDLHEVYKVDALGKRQRTIHRPFRPLFFRPAIKVCHATVNVFKVYSYLRSRSVRSATSVRSARWCIEPSRHRTNNGFVV